MSENFPSINERIVNISEEDPGNWEENYRHALNALLHMKSFVLGYAHADHRKIFLSAESNLITTYIKVEWVSNFLGSVQSVGASTTSK